jgi:phage-related protein
VENMRDIIFYKQYFTKFFAEQPKFVKEKVAYVFKVIRTVDKVPEKFLKHLTDTDGLCEIRIEVKSNAYRIFCCFDKGKLVVLFNAFQKKDQKIDRKEIRKAIKLKDEYFKIKKR